jgi:hypothetical protein
MSKWYEDPAVRTVKEARKGMTKAEATRDRFLHKAYGISLADYNRMLAEQEGGCAICRTLLAPGSKLLCVDHEHGGSDRVRGLLCNRCNVMLGMACDSVDNLQAGIDYLLNWWKRV